MVQTTDMKYSAIILVFLIYTGFLSQATPVARYSELYQADERNQAIEMFHSGKFGEALPIFQKLSNAYPSDYLLKYFTGACLVETGNTGKEAEMNLLLAITREVPSRIFYYLGKLYHMKEDWDNALRFYNRFKNNSTEKEAEELNIAYLSELAYEHKNPFAGEQPAMNESREKEISQPAEPTTQAPSSAETAIRPDTPPVTAESKPAETTGEQKEAVVIPVPADSLNTLSEAPEAAPAIPATTEHIQPEAVEVAPSKEVFPDVEFISFRINPQVTYLTEDFFQVTEAWEAWQSGHEKEREMERIMASMEKMRSNYQNTSDAGTRTQLSEQIIRSERDILRLKSETDLLYQKSRQLEQQFWSNASQSAFNTYLQAHDSLLRLEEKMKQRPSVSIPDLELLLAENEGMAPGEEDSEEGERERAPASDEVIYKVQLGSFTSAVPARTKALFDKISKIRTIETFTAEDGATVYTTGQMKTFEDALALQNQVRLEGIKDAFVIAILNEKRISLPEAKKITQEE